MTNSQAKHTNESEKLLGALFGSETRAKILRILILNGQKALRLSEISKQTDMDISGIHREISNLVSLGILNVNTNIESKNPEYKINMNNILFKGLEEIFKKAESFSKKYFLFEEIPSCYPLAASDYMNAKVSNDYLKSRSIKTNITKTLSIYEYPKLNAYFCYDEIIDISREIFNKIIENPKFGTNYVQDCIELSYKLLRTADEIEEQNYTSFSNQEIIRLLKKYYNSYETTHIIGWLGNAVDMVNMIFTKHLLFLLQEKIRKKCSLLKAGNVFSRLTTSSEESSMQKEYENLLRIIGEIYENKNIKEIFRDFEPRHILNQIKNKSIGKRIEEHTHDYGWIGYGFIGPNWDEGYFIGIISSLIRQDIDPNKKLEEIKKNKEDLIKDQEKLVKTLELDKNEQALFEVARGIIFTKGLRKDAMFKFLSRIELFYREISRRSHVSITDIRFCFPHEFDKLIANDAEFIRTLRERQKFMVCESTGAYEDDLYLIGDEAKKYIEKIPFEKEESSQVSVLNGTCACPGRVRGKVKIINTPKDMYKMEKGDILVSISTTPDLVNAMKKAGAIVTDIGGITCHAAIVSRELNIPCVVGTRIATKALKDNVLVEVDATHGIVKIIEQNK